MLSGFSKLRAWTPIGTVSFSGPPSSQQFHLPHSKHLMSSVSLRCPPKLLLWTLGPQQVALLGGGILKTLGDGAWLEEVGHRVQAVLGASFLGFWSYSWLSGLPCCKQLSMFPLLPCSAQTTTLNPQEPWAKINSSFKSSLWCMYQLFGHSYTKGTSTWTYMVLKGLGLLPVTAGFHHSPPTQTTGLITCPKLAPVGKVGKQKQKRLAHISEASIEEGLTHIQHV